MEIQRENPHIVPQYRRPDIFFVVYYHSSYLSCMFVEIIIDIYLQMISKYFISDQEPAAEKRCVNI